MTLPKSVGGRYELGELLGYGGMAEVHKGKDVRLGRDVAVKVLRADLARDPSFQTRFRREAQAAAGLNHPAIVAVYDTGEDRVRTANEEVVSPYIVMEYVEGRTLREILKAEGQLPVRRAMEIVAEICSALDFSHRSGIVHRDIKPANVMVTKDGAVKVMDFGIARALADNAATVTATAAVIGTAQYLSPEQARGESVDARSDVYSTGCLLYELITGHPPFIGDSPVAVAYQHVRENARIPSTVNAAVPRELDSIIMKALAKNPLNRYQTAAEMRLDLQRAIAGQRVEAETVMTDAERTQFIATPPVNGRRPPTGSASVLPVNDYAEDERSSHKGAIIWTLVVLVLLAAIGGTGYLVLRNTNNSGPKTFAMPKLVGLTQNAAEIEIRNAGLVPAGTPTSTSATCDGNVVPSKNQVCTQNPAAGSQVKKSQTVMFTLWAGPATVTVPQVTNLQLNEAQAKLSSLGFKINPASYIDNSLSPGTVVGQDPPAGSPAVPGAAVTLTVANGKQQLIGGLIGRDVGNAEETLNRQHWVNIVVVTAPATGKFKSGQVMQVYPTTGLWYDPTQQITLTVAAPPATSACPSSSAPTSPGASVPAGSTLPAASTAPTTTAPTGPTTGASTTPTC